MQHSRLLRRMVFCSSDYCAASPPKFAAHHCQARPPQQLIALHSPRLCSTFNQERFELPDVIEQDFLKWEEGAKAEGKEIDQIPWLGFSLRLLKVSADSRLNSYLLLSTRNLTTQQNAFLHSKFMVRQPVKIQLAKNHQDSDSSALLLVGVVKSYSYDVISIKLVGDKYITSKQLQKIHLGQRFDLRISESIDSYEVKPLLPVLSKLPGLEAMLVAYKCKPIPHFGSDPDLGQWFTRENRADYDSSQLAALGAALNRNRPIVAIHGASGTGKSRVLAEYLRISTQRDPNCQIAVVSGSAASQYALIEQYCLLACEQIVEFFTLRRHNVELIEKVVKDSVVKELLELTCSSSLPTKMLGKETIINLERGKELGNSFRRNNLSPEQLKSALNTIDSFFAEIGPKIAEDERKLLKYPRILFMPFHSKVIKKITKLGVHFDEVVLDDAGQLNECQSWANILPLAPRIRLFGDCFRPSRLILTEEAKELEFDKTLLQRLDERFGAAEVNFHLTKQYTAHPAIRLWGDRMGARAAEPANEMVKNCRLESILEKAPSADLITDPLVLVDIGRLEGEWREWMFKSECPETMPKCMNKENHEHETYHNLGMALLVAHHANLLLQHGLASDQIAYTTPSSPQQLLLTNIFSALYPQHLRHLHNMCIGKRSILQGQHVSVHIKTSLNPHFKYTEWTRNRLLAVWNDFLGRTKHQFLLIANSQWLEEGGSPGSREMMDCFREAGRIVGPNDLFPLEPGQFEQIAREVSSECGESSPQHISAFNPFGRPIAERMQGIE